MSEKPLTPFTFTQADQRYADYLHQPRVALFLGRLQADIMEALFTVDCILLTIMSSNSVICRSGRPCCCYCLSMSTFVFSRNNVRGYTMTAIDRRRRSESFVLTCSSRNCGFSEHWLSDCSARTGQRWANMADE